MKEIKDSKMWRLFDLYTIWSSLPKYYSTFTDEKLKGYNLDSEIIELIKMPTKKEFCEKFKVSLSTLKRWDNTQELQDRLKENYKEWAKKLTPNVIGKLYEKIMEEGDASRIKLWKEFIVGQNAALDVNTGLDRILENIKEEPNGDNNS